MGLAGRRVLPRFFRHFSKEFLKCPSFVTIQPVFYQNQVAPDTCVTFILYDKGRSDKKYLPGGERSVPQPLFSLFIFSSMLSGLPGHQPDRPLYAPLTAGANAPAAV